MHIRSSDIHERKRCIRLIELVREYGGKTLIFSSMHTSGEQLTLLTGVAAILHFPCPDLEEEVEIEQEAQRLKNLGVLGPREEDEYVTQDTSISLGD